MYSAARNAGAFKQEKGQNPYKIKVDSHKNRKLKIVASRSHAREELERFLNRIDNYEIIDMGSSLKLCLVADGSAQLYPRFGPTMEWDTAAAHCIVNEAGGNVTDIQGNPLRYNKPDLVNPDFIVSGDPGLFWRKYFL
jgi:3'(2'), 5'-bisphosphate nucleotidase